DFAVLRRHGSGVSCNMPGVIIENADGVRMEHLDVNGDWTEKGTEGHGAVFRNCKNGSLKTIIMEYVCGSGVIIENCSGLDIENLQAYTIKNVGIYIDGLKDSAATVVRVTNGGEVDQVSKRENYFLKNCSNVVFDSVISNFAYGEGMVIEKCSDMTINSFIYSEVRSGLDAYALFDGGGNQNVVINGFTDQSASSERKGRSLSLTGSGITVNSALLAFSEYRERINGEEQGAREK
ncbi:MAG: hypothetical protein IKS28_09255, partial [Clostridia bacterium]|nr:hypothetical protein [Clostridia bacterium]